MRRELRIAGFGGQGVISIGTILGRAAVLHDHHTATLTADYGPEKTGGWSKADLVIEDNDIGYPLVESPQIMVLLSQDAYRRYGNTLRPGGRALVEADLVHLGPEWHADTIRVPAIARANQLGKKVVANIVMVGALVAETGVVSVEAARKAVLDTIPKGTERLNMAAFEAGLQIAKEVHA